MRRNLDSLKQIDSSLNKPKLHSLFNKECECGNENQNENEDWKKSNV